MSSSMKAWSWLLAIGLAVPSVGTAQAIPAAATEQWTRGMTESRCKTSGATLEAQLQAELERRPLPDSAGAVELALEALGGRSVYPIARVTTYARAANGILIAIDLVGSTRTPEIRDGTATVYVHDGRCVTLLGW